ncbi:MAG: FAD-dependent oxidoreductase [Candidatus Muiribacteriota bacterium]
MSKEFTCVPFDKLLKWILDEYNSNKTIFGIDESNFFKPTSADPFSFRKYNKYIETPLGVAAGPHTQLAQNIISAWLCGARFIELKTVQTLDEIEVLKPCIDIENEGYNGEWSQELTLNDSYNEYLKAWVIIHILSDIFGYNNGTDEIGTIFNMSAGYDLEGIKKDNMQKFFSKMKNSSKNIEILKNEAANFYENSLKLKIPANISDNVTLSTMHGCPPAEIEKIAIFLIEEMGFHTTIKFNPTLIGKEKLKYFLNEKLNYDTIVPDEAFEHDPVYDDALKIIKNVAQVAEENVKEFSYKLSNTLESVNHKDIFPEGQDMMYMSGRPLHVIDVNLGSMLADDNYGQQEVSFSGGGDCFNFAELISTNIKPVTVCSDILKPGGYGKLNQYINNLREQMQKYDSDDIGNFIVKKYFQNYYKDEEFSKKLKENFENNNFIKIDDNVFNNLIQKLPEEIHYEKLSESIGDLIQHSDKNIISVIFEEIIKTCGRINLKYYAEEASENRRYRKDFINTQKYKGNRKLDYFNCMKAPCRQECPVSQNVPEYMRLIAEKNFKKAAEVVFHDNPVANIAGRVCDHQCTYRCTRTHIDTPLKIREIKRFITDNNQNTVSKVDSDNKKAAIIGAGPAGLSCAWFLAKNNVKVTVYESKKICGGMASHAIPSFRLPDEKIKLDVEVLKQAGVHFVTEITVGKDISFEILKKDYDFIFIGAGAKNGIKLNIDGEESDGVIDALKFLELIRKNKWNKNPSKIGVIGGGNSAVDVARTAWRLHNTKEVHILYRRTQNEMPADPEEIEELKKEKINIVELVSPVKINSENNKLKSVVCQKMKLGKKDASGRRRPVPIEGSQFEIELDLLVVAISQKTDLSFLETQGINLTRWNTVDADLETMKTSIDKVYAGGDVVHGPSTLIKAAGDGKKAAFSFLEKNPSERNENVLKEKDKKELSVKKTFVNQGEEVEEIPVEKRKNFNETTQTFSEAQAVNEAKRCLSCDLYCGICTSVCPNRANFSYKTELLSFPEKIYLKNEDDFWLSEKKLKIKQSYQIANIGDCCNECGNCTTFCPTADAPYKNKPKFYLQPESFDCHKEDGFIFQKENDTKILLGRIDEKIHSLALENNLFLYKGSEFEAEINTETLHIQKFKSLINDKEINLNNLFNMIVFYKFVKI